MGNLNQKVKIIVLLLALLVILLVLDRVLGAGKEIRFSVISAVHAAEEVQEETTPFVEVEVQISETVQDTLLKLCQDRGYKEDCAKTLLGMLWKESTNNAKAIGDQGRARGYFQIHYRLHKISIACAEDLICSANWTLDYLERNGYPRYISHAIQCHNGCHIANGYWQSVVRWGNRKWDIPLPLDTDPTVAMK